MRTEDMPVDVPLVDSVENEGVSVPNNAETPVLTYLGDASSWDVWVEAPIAWRGASVQLRVYARFGGQSVLVKTVQFSEAPSTDPISTILCSVRGRPCTAIELKVFHTVGSTLINGKFKIQAWTGGALPVTTSPARWDATTVRGLGSGGSVVIQPSGTLPVSLGNLGTGDNPMVTQSHRPGVALSAVTMTTGISQTGGAVRTLGLLWSSGSHGQDAELRRVTIFPIEVSSGQLSLRVNYVVGSPSLSGPIVPAYWDLGASATNPAVVYNTYSSGSRKGDLFAAGIDMSKPYGVTWVPGETGQRIVLHKSTAEGIEIRAVNEVGIGKTYSALVTFEWVELS